MQLSARLLGLFLTLACMASFALAQPPAPAVSAPSPPPAPALPTWNFINPDELKLWHSDHDLLPPEHTAEGVVLRIIGDDPYLHREPADFPPDRELWLNVRLKAPRTGIAQVFYAQAGHGFSEDRSVRFTVPGGDWQALRVPIPALGPGEVIRFDPPGAAPDVVTVSSMSFEIRPQLREPPWPKPAGVALGPDAPRFSVGALSIAHDPKQWGAMTVSIANRPFAIGNTAQMLGIVVNGETKWLELTGRVKTRVTAAAGGLDVEGAFRDDDGGDWTIHLAAKPATPPTPVPGAADTLDITVDVAVSQDRRVVFMPMLMLLPGVGIEGFGEHKTQAVFPGLEYLDRDEPSSSEADIIGPGSHRQIPNAEKITIPMMALAHDGRWLALSWDPSPDIAAVFDSPDRLFHSGGHVLGLIAPGSSPDVRPENHLVPSDALLIRAGTPLKLHARLSAGAGSSVVPAIASVVALRGLPDVPDAGSLKVYGVTASAGWLDSGVHVDGGRFRHAFPGFGAQTAPDAAAFMAWLATQVADNPEHDRLVAGAAAARAAAAKDDAFTGGVGHVRTLAAALSSGRAADAVEQARAQGHAALAQFQPDGTILYTPPAAGHGNDLSRTNPIKHADGLTANIVRHLLWCAMTSGDTELVKAGLEHLDKLAPYDQTVPRGAQTWEVPLHTPDILASAQLVRAYTLGYELSRNPERLARARYWAWTGVPFVYLRPPADKDIGTYATIAVFGATQWKAPNWMGMPVQWCGLVYADALYELALVDPDPVQAATWRRLADGITASGVQQTFPLATAGASQRVKDRQGLLPDSFMPVAQIRNDPAINPGTLEVCAARLFARPALASHRVILEGGAATIIHAPGTISDLRAEGDRITFALAAWPQEPYQVLVTGLAIAPAVFVNNAEVKQGVTFDRGVLIVPVAAQKATIELRPAQPAAQPPRPAHP